MKPSRILNIIILSWCIGCIHASNINVANTVDSTVFLIGNQTNVRFSVSQPRNTAVVFPALHDTLASGVEIVAEKAPDTTALDDNRIEINKDYIVSAYDSGVYFIPELPFVDKLTGDTVWSQAVALKVYTYDIDTANMQLFDIKPIRKPPFPWRYALGIALIIYLVFVAIALIAFIIWRLKQNKPIFPQKIQPEPDPYEVAMSGLEKIKSEKLWQKDQEKEFQTELTDVLRTYLLKRFGIEAIEMTSDEILDEVMRNDECKPLHDELRYILKSADMVKFAKMKLAPDESEKSIQNAFEFLEKTKKEETTEEPNETK